MSWFQCSCPLRRSDFLDLDLLKNWYRKMNDQLFVGHSQIRSVRVLLVFLCLVQSTSRLQAQDAVQVEILEEQAFKQAAALMNPSIVRIETVGGRDQIGNQLTQIGPTSGVVVSKDGYIISSAFNFASKPSTILVTLADGRRFPAEIVASDRLKMLTLLKVNTNDLVVPRSAGQSDVKVGQWAIALGRTFDNSFPSLSVGIISALNRIWGKALQTDAKVSPVNYGGPLVDLDGRVLGILVPLSPRAGSETAGVEWYDSGIGFAIPYEDVLASLDRLKQGKDMFPGLMGISFKAKSSIAALAVIDRVRYGSPAQEAGLKAGDEIVEVEGRPVVRMAEIKQVLGTRYAGDKIKLTVKRDGKTFQGELTLVDKLLPYESGFLGILPERKAISNDATGVGIRHVFSKSPADVAGLKKMDRIVRFNGQEILDNDSLIDLISRIRPGESVEIAVRRGEEELVKNLELATVPNESPAEISPVTIPTPAAVKEDEEKDDDKKSPPVGRFTKEYEEHDHSAWLYVPDDYNADYEYGLMVWIHPQGDTMEADVFKQWKSICDRRGLIMLAPRAAKKQNWILDEAEFVKDAVESVQQEYSVDRSRTFLHSYTSGVPFTFHLTFKYRELFHAAAVAAAGVTKRPPENQPEFRQQFYFMSGEKDPKRRLIEASVSGLRRMKFPTGLTIFPQKERSYPGPDELKQLSDWIDALDQI